MLTLTCCCNKARVQAIISRNSLLSKKYMLRYTLSVRCTEIRWRPHKYIVYSIYLNKPQEEKYSFAGAANGRRSCAKNDFFLFHMKMFRVLTLDKVNCLYSLRYLLIDYYIHYNKFEFDAPDSDCLNC